MNKRLLDNLQEMKDNQGVNFVSFTNTGDERYYDYKLQKDIDWANISDCYIGISNTLCKAIEKSIKGNDFDTVNMELILGLVYEASELDENGQITAKSKPVKNIVRYYTGPISCLLDGETANEFKYGEIWPDDGVIRYSKLLAGVKEDGFILDAPQSFDEFKKAILSGEPFDINLSAKFKTKEMSKGKQFVKKR